MKVRRDLVQYILWEMPYVFLHSQCLYDPDILRTGVELKSARRRVAHIVEYVERHGLSLPGSAALGAKE